MGTSVTANYPVGDLEVAAKWSARLT